MRSPAQAKEATPVYKSAARAAIQAQGYKSCSMSAISGAISKGQPRPSLRQVSRPLLLHPVGQGSRGKKQARHSPRSIPSSRLREMICATPYSLLSVNAPGFRPTSSGCAPWVRRRSVCRSGGAGPRSPASSFRGPCGCSPIRSRRPGVSGAFPTQSSTLPEPFPGTRGQSVFRLPDLARAGACAQSAAQVLEFCIARPGLRLHVALSRLFRINVARPGVDREASMQPGSVNVAGAGRELRVFANAVVVDIARAGARIQKGICRGFDLVFDADVVQVSCRAPMRMMFPVCSTGGLAAICRTCSSLPPQPDLTRQTHAPVARAVGQVNVARSVETVSSTRPLTVMLRSMWLPKPMQEPPLRPKPPLLSKQISSYPFVVEISAPDL